MTLYASLLSFPSGLLFREDVAIRQRRVRLAGGTRTGKPNHSCPTAPLSHLPPVEEMLQALLRIC